MTTKFINRLKSAWSVMFGGPINLGKFDLMCKIELEVEGHKFVIQEVEYGVGDERNMVIKLLSYTDYVRKYKRSRENG